MCHGSIFAGRGKKTAWSTWNAFPEAIRALDWQVTQDIFATLQKIVLMYARSSALANVNTDRQVLFERNSKSLGSIPLWKLS
jgi:hypothetical protein